MKAYGKNVLRAIIGNKRRSITLLLITALGAAFFVGLRSTAPDMRLTFDNYFTAKSMYDIKLQGTLGLTDRHVEDFRLVTGVEQAEPAYSIDLFARTGDLSYLIRFHSWNEDGEGNLALTEVIDGRMPEEPGECAVEYRFSLMTGIGIGDALILSTGDDTQLENIVSHGSYIITGLIDSPLYVRADLGTSSKGSGSLDAYAYIPFDDFKLDTYTEVLLTLSNPEGIDRFDSRYKDMSAAAEDELQLLGDEMMAARRRILMSRARKTISEGVNRIAETRESLAQGKAELDNIDQALIENERELSNQRGALESGYLDALSELESKDRELLNARTELEQGRIALDAARGEFYAKRLELERPEMAASITDAELKQLELAEMELNERERELHAVEAELDVAYMELLDAADTLDAALYGTRARIYGAEAELLVSRMALEDEKLKFEALVLQTEAELREAENELTEARRTLDTMPEAKFYVLGLDKNSGFMSFDQDSDRIDAISRVFPLIFFLVAALVAFTGMVRIVEDDRPTIAAMLSLGYGPGHIIGMYLIYALGIGILGTILGIASGYKLFPSIIFNMGYKIMYITPPIETPLYAGLCARTFIVSLLSVSVPSVLVASTYIKTAPSELMRPKAPPPGKRIILERVERLWKIMSFSAKVTARNILRYKKRFIMTVTGIIGCTAIMLTGFGVRDSIKLIAINQFDRIFLFNFHVSMSDSAVRSDKASIERYLDSQPDITGRQYQHRENVEATIDNEKYETTLIVPDDPEHLGEFILLAEMKTGRELKLDSSSAVITQKLASLLNISIGDDLTLIDEDDAEFTVVVSGIVENYAGHYVYIAPEYYREIFDAEPDYSDILFSIPECDAVRRDEVSEIILENDGVGALSLTETVRDFYTDAVNSLNVVVLVLIVSGALLAFVVLFSLTGINIDERKRELATLKVLGFYDNEASSYIFRENIVNTVIGTGLGLIAGIFLHSYVIRTAEVEMLMFAKDIEPMSFVFAAALTLIFMAVVNAVMSGSIRNIDMIESLKSVE